MAGTTSQYNAYVARGNGAEMFKSCLLARGCWKLLRAEDGDDTTSWDLWYGNNGQACPFKRLRPGLGSDSKTRLVGRLPANRELCTKARLAHNMARYAAQSGQPLDFIPETYIVSAKLQFGNEKERLFAAAAAAQDAGRGTVWIVKPNGQNRGIGIGVVNSMEEALTYINGKGIVGSSWVIQKYIERPLLLGGRKFDVRSYVLVTPDKRAFFHQESYVRTSSTAFRLDNLQDRCIHLTNDAVQNQAQHYDAFEDHNKLTLQQLQQCLSQQGCTLSIDDDIMPKMRDAASRVFSVALAAMQSARINHCFELYGLDFMISEDGQVFLIEVNTCPALAQKGAVLQDLLPRVMEEVVQKAIDPLFPPPAALASDTAAKACSSLPATDAHAAMPEASPGAADAAVLGGAGDSAALQSCAPGGTDLARPTVTSAFAGTQHKQPAHCDAAQRSKSAAASNVQAADAADCDMPPHADSDEQAHADKHGCTAPDAAHTCLGPHTKLQGFVPLPLVTVGRRSLTERSLSVSSRSNSFDLSKGSDNASPSTRPAKPGRSGSLIQSQQCRQDAALAPHVSKLSNAIVSAGALTPAANRAFRL